jgi:L-threonylcarbamoyladenylate synthase
VRVSNHPVVKALCELFQKPLVSTSANLSGMPAAKTPQEVLVQFGNQVTLISGKLGESLLPSMIRHGISGKVIRDN